MQTGSIYIVFAACLISVVVSVASVLIGRRAKGHDNPVGMWLGRTMDCGAAVILFYLMSALCSGYTAFSLFSALYFCFIDLMLLSLVQYTWYFTKRKNRPGRQMWRCCLLGFGVVDIAIQLFNVVMPVSITYVARNTQLVRYQYQMHALYVGHLVYTYLLCLVVLVLLGHRMVKVPTVYRKQYSMTIGVMLLIVGMNAVYLYWPQLNPLDVFDYSVWGYGFGFAILYWVTFIFPKAGMANHFRSDILANINQGILLFDYEDKLLENNSTAARMLPEVFDGREFTVTDLVQQCGITRYRKEEACNSFSMQCYFNGDEALAMRCDYRPLCDDNGNITGKLFVFTESNLKTDLLTGFIGWNNFEKIAQSAQYAAKPAAVAVCDVLALRLINETYGRSRGDRLLAAIAQRMRQNLPSNALFVRGPEANFFAITALEGQGQLTTGLETIVDEMARSTIIPGGVKMQYAVCTGDNGAMAVLQEAKRALAAKKTLDSGSTRSHTLSSLMRALQECDSDTEAHVQRTQQMGARLARRIGLNETDRSRFSLLCMLHDIGKIGIPSEILNKAGKLNAEEWSVIKTHVEKGYKIALSTEEFKPIAEMILHHHERWDGRGYPNGLNKESIPLLSRIIAVVDAYDAMISRRAYKGPMSREAAMEELRACAGTQFDPWIVSEFLLMLEGDTSLGNPIEQGTGEASGRRSWQDFYTSEEAGLGTVRALDYSSYITDENDRIIQIDYNFTLLTQYTTEDIEQKVITQLDLIFEEDREDYAERTAKMLMRNQRALFEHRIRRKDGSEVYVICYGSRYFDEKVGAERNSIMITNVVNTNALNVLLNEKHTQDYQRLEKWEKRYRCDAMTGLLNREAFKNDVEEKLLNGQCRVLLMMMDVDNFKNFNDTKGHPAGDELLRRLALTLNNVLRVGDFAARMGGDEFAAAILYDDSTSDARMMQRAHDAVECINKELMSFDPNVCLSMGAAVSAGGESFNKLYRAADQKLYACKMQHHSRQNVQTEAGEYPV